MKKETDFLKNLGVATLSAAIPGSAGSGRKQWRTPTRAIRFSWSRCISTGEYKVPDPET